MPPLILATNTDPGTAFWVDAAIIGGGSVAPITGLTFVDANYSGATPPDGSIAAPFPTIQGALTAIGDATTLAEQFQGWKVIISASFYDEDLVIPERRNIVLDCAPGVILADTFPPTTARKITWAQNLPPLGTIESYGLQINNLIMFDGIELISTPPGVPADPTMELRLNQVSFISGVVAGTIASIDGAGIAIGSAVVEVRDCLLRDTGGTGFCFNDGGSKTYLSYANSCEFSASIVSLGYGQMVNSTFTGNQTYRDQSSVGNLDRPEGFFGCQFDAGTPNTFTMTNPGQFLMDGVTWNTCSNTTFFGATVTSLDDEYVAGNTLAGNATWAAGGDNTLSDAIDRIANALPALIGTPIP